VARTKARRWLGIDGEGVGRKPHRYVMLACSDGDVIENAKGLGTRECLDFLIGLSTRDVRLCGYYLSYDWTKILADLPDEDLYRLFRPDTRAHEDRKGFEWITWGDYRIHWLAHAMWVANDERSVVVWDLGRFYQGPFVGALKDWGIAPEVQARIQAMKDKRSTFTWRQRKKIREYCLSECRALSELATALERAHTDAGVVPRSWHGPGSTAGALLHRHGISEMRGSHPAPVLAAAQIAYVGGRAEIACSGKIDRPVYGYDITSAYPYHASSLPCLMHSRWWRVGSERVLEREHVGIVCGDIDRCNSDWGPLPVRLRTGAIVFPRGGARGYWYRDEWLQARSWPNSRLRFDHAFVLRCECECRPFAFLRSVFEERLRVGKSTGAGKILKLAMNSVYGKLAQNAGSGQYQSRIWAGMITSGTRAQVLSLMAQHKRLDSVIMVATDGVFSTEERDTPGPITLGGWERSDYPDGVTLVRPGIYFSGDKLRARGMGRSSLQRAKDELIAALDAGEPRALLSPRTAFGAATSTITRSRDGQLFRRSARYGQWYEIPTRISLSPAPKRSHDWSPPLLDGVESAPFDATTQPEIAVFRDLLKEFRATQEGTA
jgi:hypothetical protein